MSDAGPRTTGNKIEDSTAPLPGPVGEDGLVETPGGEDVDETTAGGLNYPDEFSEVNARDLGEKPVEPGP